MGYLLFLKVGIMVIIFSPEHSQIVLVGTLAHIDEQRRSNCRRFSQRSIWRRLYCLTWSSVFDIHLVIHFIFPVAATQACLLQYGANVVEDSSIKHLREWIVLKPFWCRCRMPIGVHICIFSTTIFLKSLYPIRRVLLYMC